MKLNIRVIVLTALLILLCALTGCTESMDTLNGLILSADETYEKDDVEQVAKDKKSLYENNELAVETMYIATAMGNPSDGTDKTWSEINSTPYQFYIDNNIDKYRCEAVVQMGDEMGPIEGKFGYGNLTSNATVRVQGEKSSERQQKSYRVDIKEGKGNIDGIKSFVLEKSFTDPFRFTSKLMYDLMAETPDMFSTRTKFVHLYVKDTNNPKNSLYVDYGLYTLEEVVNKNYLKKRELDQNAALYKAEDFDFGRHEDTLMLATERGFNEREFEKLLGIKGSDNHTELLNMLKAVNDFNIPINDVLNQYFDKDNLYCWMAFQILTSNTDVSNKDFYLYNPTGSIRFYFMSWGSDGAFRTDYESMRDADYTRDTNKGVLMFTDSVLFKRILQDKSCVNELSDKIEELYSTTLNPDNVARKADAYSSLIYDYVYNLPDRGFARLREEQYPEFVTKLSAQISENYFDYFDSLNTPWPFHILEPEGNGDNITIRWSDSYCADQEVTYTVFVDDGWDFDTPIVKKTGIKSRSLEIGKLEPGQYFISITANAADGSKGIVYENYPNEQKGICHGVLSFYVLSDNSVHASFFEED